MSWTYLGNSKLQLLSCRKGIQAARKARSNWHLERFTPASTRMKGMPKQMQAIWQPDLAFRVMWSDFMWGAVFPCSPGPTCWSSNIIKKAPWVWDCCNGKHGSTRREWGAMQPSCQLSAEAYREAQRSGDSGVGTIGCSQSRQGLHCYWSDLWVLLHGWNDCCRSRHHNESDPRNEPTERLPEI